MDLLLLLLGTFVAVLLLIIGAGVIEVLAHRSEKKRIADDKKGA